MVKNRYDIFLVIHSNADHMIFQGCSNACCANDLDGIGFWFIQDISLKHKNGIVLEGKKEIGGMNGIEINEPD